MSEPAGLLDDQVDGFGASVGDTPGVEVGQDSGLPGSEGAAESGVVPVAWIYQRYMRPMARSARLAVTRYPRRAQWLFNRNGAAKIRAMPQVDATLSKNEQDKVDREVEIVVRAARVFAAVTAESIAQAGDKLTLPQLRVLTLALASGSLNNGQVADALNVHISNASRICERLVQAKLLSRRDSPTDRRQVELTLTDQGAELITQVTSHRRGVFLRTMLMLSDTQRSTLAQALTDFTEAVDQNVESPHAYLP